MMPYRKIKVGYSIIEHILYLPSGQRIITCSRDGSLRVWDLECGTQVGKEWEDNDARVFAIALSPDGETVVSGSQDGTVKLWNIDTGKVIKKWMGHTKRVESVCWSPDGERVVSRSDDDTFRVWDVKSGETIIGPINAKIAYRGRVCYSPDATMIAISGRILTIWDANTGQLLKKFFLGPSRIAGYLGWTSDGKTLFAGEVKIDTPTWTVDNGHGIYFQIISLSPSDERIFASMSRSDFTVQLYNFETDQPIGTPLRHENYVQSGIFSADGKFLVTSCRDNHIYTWDLSAIVKEADLQSDIADGTPEPAPKMTGAAKIPPGFFDDALREANLHTRLSQSHGAHDHPTPTPRQRPLSRFFSFLRRSKPTRETESDTQSRSHYLNWTRNLVSGILRRRDGSDMQLRETEVPYTGPQPRNYHARVKKAASSSRPSNIHTTQQLSATTQTTPPSSQQPPLTAATSALSTPAGTPGTMGAPSRPHVIVAGWRARFVSWLCFVPVQTANGQP
jgi:hypothetical protein